jgi:AmmeMemoRadiSam system protein B/AmmeMemoRadiSam system protein A
MTTGNLDLAARSSLKSKPELRPDQKEHILAAAGELLRATLAERPAELSDPTLAGAADREVAGTFISLKRGKHLRSCCGFLGRTLSLMDALREAVDRAAWDDPRFPPLSPGELVHLHLEVWLLDGPEPVRAEGDERVRAVTVGKHGLTVTRGQSHGLLLPCVAVDHGWDARRFLDQVCVKAGLHPTAWKDNGTSLFTFEGEVLSGGLATDTEPTDFDRSPAWLSRDELRGLADFCRGNLAALLNGGTPSYYAFGLPDRHVTAAALTVRRPGDHNGLTSHRLSLRPGFPLQATLYSLTQTVAGLLDQQGVTAENLEALEVGVGVYFDPALHGTVADPELDGVEPRQRALLVLEKNRSALVYLPGLSLSELLEEAARQGRVREPAAAAVYSLAALTTEPSLALASIPHAVRGPTMRPPGVAGRFYPGAAGELDDLVSRLLAGERRPESWPAAMVPHAGLIYSGDIAAAVFQRLNIPRTVIVLGPKHTGLGVDWAVAPHETWSIPGHSLASDPKLVAELAEAIPGLELDALAHQQEHAIEVELPFIARLAPKTRVVGIAIGDGKWDACRRFASGLADVLHRREDPPLLLVSSDMNHFATDVENRRLDEMALAALEGLDPQDVYDTVHQNHISMCGVLPAVIVMQTLKLLGKLSKAERVGYKTSGDVTGDRSRVVGYAGMLFG